MSNDTTTNVTLRLPSTLVKNLRHRAVDADMSLSAWFVHYFERHPSHVYTSSKDRYEKARQNALEMLRDKKFNLGGKPLSREECHER